MAPGLVLPTPVAPPAPSQLPTSSTAATPESPATALTPLVQEIFRTSTLCFYLNGTRLELRDVDPEATLLDFIRSQRRLTGTKLGCGEGGCGACTVVVQQFVGGRVQHLAVNACLAPVISVEGKHVITVEGLGTAANPHPLQERLAKLHGSQCGFCTPGIVMSLYALLRNAYDPHTNVYRLTEEMVETDGALDGNLCRCTGYKPILDAAKSFIREDLGAAVVVSEPSAEEEEEEASRSLSEGAAAEERGRNGNARTPSRGGGCGGRPGGCCRDTNVDRCPSSGEESVGSADEEKDSSGSRGTPVTEPSDSEVPVSGADYGAPARVLCGRDDCCQLPGSGSASEAHTTTTLCPPDAPEQGRYAFPQFDFKAYSPATEIIFPPPLRRHEYKPICFGNARKIWFRPVTLEQVLRIKDAFPAAKMVAGSSEVQVEVRFKNAQFAVAVYVGDVDELKGFAVDAEKGEAVIGANTSLSVVEKACADWAARLGGRQRGRGLVLEAVRKQLRCFAGRQIRNTATLAGNIATASPISDLNPVLVASNAMLVAHSLATGAQEISVRRFFRGYRQTALPADAVITRVVVPLGHRDQREVVKAYKQARRKDDDIAIVTAGFRVRLSDAGVVEDVCLAYGGMAPTTVEARHAQTALLWKTWFDPDVLADVMAALERDFDLAYSVPGGMATYRRTLAYAFFLRFWHEVAAALDVGAADADIVAELPRGPSRGSRDHANPYEQRVVGQPIPHLSGLKHATGEAEYTDDIPRLDGELYGALVLSSRAHARLVAVDFAPALAVDGVRGFVDQHDLPEDRSWWGSVTKDERFFAKGEVLAHGQPIGLVFAETPAAARRGANAVTVAYEDLPALISIDEAIEARSFWPYGHMLKRGLEHGPIEAALGRADRVFEGVSKMGGQEHFYLETNAALVIPQREDGQMEVWSSTQNTMETQEFVSMVTGVPRHRIVARVKRMGGAFGGKESRSVPLAAILAVAAQKAARPVRCMLNRDEDMMTSGQRHPFQARWRVGTSADGMLLALDADVYNNAGFSTDMSSAVMDRCLTHIDNSYFIPHVHVRGHVCRTNTHSNTAFRGFGAPQGMYIMECIMTTIADKLDIDVDVLRERNLYKEGERTPFLQPLHDWHVPQLLSELKARSSYDARKAEVAAFNRAHTFHKRGLALVPTKFGISFATALHLNQAGALVHIYADGSVLLAHGGTEMGQGLHTKMAQVAAQELGVPVAAVFTADSATNTVANASPTAASSGSDLNGMAITDACAQLNARLAPYRRLLGPAASMRELAHAAYRDRVNLSANGFFRTPDIGYDWNNAATDPKPMYHYFTQGVAAAEVQLDVLTGAHVVRRADLHVDVGRSINPALDYGQVEGAFVQGQGLFTLEESLWTARDGSLATRGPATYKIPAFADIPRVFNASFLTLPRSRWKSLRSVQSSKGVGEPPLFLGAAVFFALCDAVKSARLARGDKSLPALHSPATCERLVQAVGGDTWERFRVRREDGQKPFFMTAQG